MNAEQFRNNKYAYIRELRTSIWDTNIYLEPSKDSDILANGQEGFVFLGNATTYKVEWWLVYFDEDNPRYGWIYAPEIQ